MPSPLKSPKREKLSLDRRTCAYESYRHEQNNAFPFDCLDQFLFMNYREQIRRANDYWQQ